jgi:uncharacterized protein YcbX
MNLVGQVESVWRYPVKSMRGEELPEIFVGFSGVYGDRLYAFKSSAAPAGFPFFTGRNARAMLLYRPRFRDPETAAKPVNLAEAKALSLLLSPSANLADLAVEIETPSGQVLSIDDAELLRELGALASGAHSLSLLRSERGMTDCRPISLLSLQTVTQLSGEVGTVIDKRRFRANVYFSLTADGFAEDEFVGRRVGVGAEVVVAVLDRDPRCQMITFDPETAIANPEVLRKVARAHEGTAGVYGAVLAEGMIRKNDPVTLLD